MVPHFAPFVFNSICMVQRDQPEIIILFATVDASVRGSRKIAANCVKHCDVRNSENRQSFERTLPGVGSPPTVQLGVLTFARRSVASTQRIVWSATYPRRYLAKLSFRHIRYRGLVRILLDIANTRGYILRRNLSNRHPSLDKLTR